MKRMDFHRYNLEQNLAVTFHLLAGEGNLDALAV